MSCQAAKWLQTNNQSPLERKRRRKKRSLSFCHPSLLPSFLLSFLPPILCLFFVSLFLSSFLFPLLPPSFHFFILPSIHPHSIPPSFLLAVSSFKPSEVFLSLSLRWSVEAVLSLTTAGSRQHVAVIKSKEAAERETVGEKEKKKKEEKKRLHVGFARKKKNPGS